MADAKRMPFVLPPHPAARWFVRATLVLAIAAVVLYGYLITRPSASAITAENVYKILPEAHRPVGWSAEYIRAFSSDVSNGLMSVLPGGDRYTVPPAMPKAWMFGNSTLRGQYVHDNETIPSVLQALIGSRYMVVNRGRNGSNIAGEYLLLEETNIQPGDVVIFYDGAQEVWPWTTDSPEALARSYGHYIALARAYAASHGATFYHFLQPILYSMDPATTEEAQFEHDAVTLLTDTPPPGTLMRYWQRMEAVSEHDLTHALDAARAGGLWAYFDIMHTTPEADQIIARAIYDVVWPVL